MGYNVHLHVSFKCDYNDDVAALAQRHLKLIGEDYADRYARQFLSSLAGRSGFNDGPKGGLSLWGIIANGDDTASRFVFGLTAFWKELLSGDVDGGPCDFNRIIVLFEEEQSEAANAYEIGWKEPTPAHWGIDPYVKPAIDDRVLFIKKHGPLPFSWQQW